MGVHALRVDAGRADDHLGDGAAQEQCDPGGRDHHDAAHGEVHGEHRSACETDLPKPELAEQECEQQDRQRNRHAPQVGAHRVVARAHPRPAAHQEDERRGQQQQHGEGQPLPDRLAQVDRLRPAGQRLHPVQRDHPAGVCPDDRVAVSDDRLAPGIEVTGPLVELQGPLDGLRAEEELTRAGALLDPFEHDARVRDRPARQPFPRDRLRVGNLGPPRQWDALQDVEQQDGGLHLYGFQHALRNLARVETQGRAPDPEPGMAKALARGLVRRQEDRPGLPRVGQEAPEGGARARGVGRLERMAPGLLAQLAELPQRFLGHRASGERGHGEERRQERDEPPYRDRRNLHRFASAP